MTSLIENIYYANKDILDTIKTDFELVDDKDWYQLYQHKTNKTYWRLDKWDKYQEQFFVRLDKTDNWIDFNDKELRIEHLLRTRGISDDKCILKNCDKPTLKGLVYCAEHAYEEMGIRK